MRTGMPRSAVPVAPFAAALALLLAGVAVRRARAGAVGSAADGPRAVTGQAAPDAASADHAVRRTAAATAAARTASASTGLRLRLRPRRPAGALEPVHPGPLDRQHRARRPPAALEVLRSAVARVARGQRHHWEYVGPTTTASRPAPSCRRRRGRATRRSCSAGPTALAATCCAGQPRGVLAMTRTAWFGVQHADGSKVAAMRAAVIAFDRTDRLPAARRGLVAGRGAARARPRHGPGPRRRPHAS